jgi:hypothetical protein
VNENGKGNKNSTQATGAIFQNKMPWVQDNAAWAFFWVVALLGHRNCAIPVKVWREQPTCKKQTKMSCVVFFVLRLLLLVCAQKRRNASDILVVLRKL